MSNNTFNNKIKPGKTTAFFICVLVAALLWFVKSLNTIYYSTIKIPVEFKNLPHNKKPAGQIPDFITVDIKTSGLKLFFIELNKPYKKLVIDFNNLKTSKNNYILSASGIALKTSLKFETEVKHITPDTLYFTENSGYQKNVPVKFIYAINCAKGYDFKTPDVSPAFLTIIGDSSVIKNTDTLYTQTFIENGLDRSIEKKLPVIKPSDKLFLDVNEVTVKIKVEKLFERTIELNVNVLSLPEKAKSIHIFPSKVKVKFTSMQNDFNPSDTVLFKAMVNPNTLSSGKTQVFLSTQPGNVNLISIEPKEVELLMIKK